MQKCGVRKRSMKKMPVDSEKIKELDSHWSEIRNMEDSEGV